MNVNGRGVSLGLAAIVTLAAWAYTVQGARAMSGSMPMPGGWSMSMAWMAMGGQSPVERALMFLVMWTVMMVAMMLPSAMPVVLLHRRLIAMRREMGETVTGSNFLLLAGYFAVWTGFGAIAYLLGVTITNTAMRSGAFSKAVPVATGIVLGFAGIYQLTGLKQACLAHCRSPLGIFAHHQIRRRLDSLTFGLHHGAYCAGCCWALMAIQLVLGVMSLPLMAAIAIVIYLEKSWKHGEALATVVGAAALLGGAALVVQAVR